MDLWDDLVKTALLGTQRQPPPRPPAGDALGAALEELSPAPPDAALLGMAATVTTYRRAGWLPPAEDTSTLPAPVDRNDLPQPNPRAAQALYQILGGERKDLLPEWLAAAAAAGKRLPDLALPPLLEIGRTRPELRESLTRVLGKRGHWLAAQNPQWSYATGATASESDAAAPTTPEADWETGTFAGRLALLGRLRRTDPARARALVQSTWSEEPADARTKFLSAFSAGLSPDDEPLLESALDDRGKEVRRVAADLLCRLPSSQLVRRMTQRATPLLAWKAGKKPKIEVTLPSAPDKAAERDGIDPKARGPRLGQKQSWLWQIVASVPPSAWTRAWGAKPAEIVETVRKSEFETVLVGAWALATARNEDPAWAEALLATEAATVSEYAGDEALAGLLQSLPPARREALVLENIAAGGDAAGFNPLTTQLLAALGPAWGEPLSRAVLARVRTAMRSKRDAYALYPMQQLLAEMALRVPPGMFKELSAGWPEEANGWDDWKTLVDKFLATVEFRRDMLEEIRK
jgi:hypothetical protein